MTLIVNVFLGSLLTGLKQCECLFLQHQDFVTFQEFVFSRSGGNPLFVIELVHFALRLNVRYVN